MVWRERSQAVAVNKSLSFWLWAGRRIGWKRLHASRLFIRSTCDWIAAFILPLPLPPHSSTSPPSPTKSGRPTLKPSPLPIPSQPTPNRNSRSHHNRFLQVIKVEPEALAGGAMVVSSFLLSFQGGDGLD